MSATNRGRKREAQDHYPTPWWCIDGLRRQLCEDQLRHTRVLDPACGDGRILSTLAGPGRKLGKLWREFDLEQGTDYLTWKAPGALRGPLNLVVTNPPYRLAEQFVRKALEVDGVRALCLLLRLNFLGSSKRANLWAQHPPRQIMVLTPRPSFVHGKTDACEYAWFWWGEPRLLMHPDQPFLWIRRDEQ